MGFQWMVTLLGDVVLTTTQPSHFFSGLDQFQYSDIWLNIVGWASDWDHMAMTNGTLVGWFNDTL
jgi:hypothetical protein